MRRAATDSCPPASRWQRFADTLLFRMTMFGLFIVLLGSAARSVTLKVFVRDHVEALVAANQAATAGFIARDIDFRIAARRHQLDRIARDLPPALLGRPAELRRWLAERQKFNHLFSLGLLVAPADGGLPIAEYPEVPGRSRQRLADQDWFRRIDAARPPAAGWIGVGRSGGLAVLAMASSVGSASARPTALLIGITELADPDLFGPLLNGEPGNGGGFAIASPTERRIVAASDPALALTAVTAGHPLFDRRPDAPTDTFVVVGNDGVERVATAVAVPSADWRVVVHTPKREAYGVVDKVQGHIVIGSLVTAAIFLALVVSYLRKVLRPLRDAADTMRRMADGDLALQHLPIVRHDEVGVMVGSFNRLADRLNDNEAALRERGHALEQALRELNESEARMAHMAHHDVLTGLPNRALFDDRLRQALARAERHGTGLALLFIDLDGFKPINDRHGHDIGDDVLRQVAERLREALRRADTVARIGGDEFVVIVADQNEPRPVAAAVAAKCLEAIAPPFLVGELRLTLGLSIGIALYPGDGDGTAILLAHADQAMYRAKQNGRGRFEYYGDAP